jgi:vacuolar-type H+-ATPase catalytic subunit A/Vma1
MASRPNHPVPIDVFVDDLDATLLESDKGAASIERELRAHNAQQNSLTPRDLEKNVQKLYALLSVSSALIDESHRLSENVRAARETLKDIRSELAKQRVAVQRR